MFKSNENSNRNSFSSSAASTPQHRKHTNDFISMIIPPNSDKFGYNKQNYVLSPIIYDQEFQGSAIKNQLQQRLVHDHKKSDLMPRQELGSPNPRAIPSQPSKKARSDKAVELNDVFNKHQHVLIVGGIAADNYLLSQYITYNWQENKFLGQFRHVFRVDLGILADKSWKKKEGETSTAYLARFLHNSVGDTIKITTNHIEGIINTSSGSKTLIIFDRYEKVAKLYSSPEHRYIKEMFDEASKINYIVTSNYKLTQTELPEFDITLTNIGYLERDINKYINQAFTDSDKEKILVFLAANNALQNICKSPSILNMVCYIITNSDKDVFESGITLTSLFNEISILTGKKYQGTSRSELKINDVIKFLEEFAYKSLIKSPDNLKDILSNHGISDDDFQHLVHDFGFIVPDASEAFVQIKHVFVDAMYQNFLAAFYLKNLLINKDPYKVIEATRFISNNRDDNKYFPTIKFLYGLISLHKAEDEKTRIMEYFWNSINSNALNQVRIDGDNKIMLAIELLSQATELGVVNQNLIANVNKKLEEGVEFFNTEKRSDDFTQEIIDIVDEAVITDFNKWGLVLIRNTYASPTIIFKLLDDLMNNDKHKMLKAIELLPQLNIPKAEVRNFIALELMNKVQDLDLGIAEAALRSLQYMSNCEGVKDFLSSTLQDHRINIVLVTMEVYQHLGDAQNIRNLLKKFEDSNSWIVSTAMDALTSSHHSYTDSKLFVAALIKKLGEGNNDITLKSLKILGKFTYNISYIITLLLDQILGHDLNLTKTAIAAIENLINLNVITNIDNYRVIAKTLRDKVKPYDGYFHTKVKEQNEIKADVARVLGKIFIKNSINAEELNKTTKLLITYLSDPNEDVKISAVQAFEGTTNSHTRSSEIYTDILHKMTNSKFDKAKIEAIKVIEKLFSSLGEKDKEKAIFNALWILNNNLDSALLAAALQLLNKIFDSENISINNFIAESIKPTAPDKFKEIKVRNGIIELLGDRFLQLKIQTRNESQKFLINLLKSSKNVEEVIKVIEALGKIYNAKETKQSSILVELLKGEGDAFDFKNKDIRIAIIKVLENMIIISETDKIKALDFINNKLSDDSFSEKISLMDLVRKLGDNFGTTKEKLMKLTLKGKDEEIREFAISTLLELYEEDGEDINMMFEHFLKKINLNEEFKEAERQLSIAAISSILGESSIAKDKIKEFYIILLDKIKNYPTLKKEYLTSLAKFIHKVPKDDLKELLDILFKSAQDRVDLNNLVIKILNILNTRSLIPAPLTELYNELLYKFIEGKINAYNNEKNHQEDAIDELASRYSKDKIAEVTLEDKALIEEHQELILLRALESKNEVIHDMLFGLLNKITCNPQSFINVINYKLKHLAKAEDKAVIINLVLNKFHSSDEYIANVLEEKLFDLAIKTVKKEFINIAYILEHLKDFTEYVAKNNLGVKFTNEYLIVSDNKYPLSLNKKDIATSLINARVIYLALIAELGEEDTILSSKTADLFTEATGTHLENDEVQITILKKYPNKYALKESKSTSVILICEENTIFGSTLIRSFNVEDGRIQIAYYSSSDLGYKQKIFGKSAESYVYEIKSITINRDKLGIILSNVNNCNSDESLYNLAKKTINEEHLSNSNHKLTSASLSQYQVLGTETIQEKLASLQMDNEAVKARLAELTKDVVTLAKDFKDFTISQDSINEIVLFLSKREYVSPIEGLTVYQEAVARTIMFELDALYTAAKVVQTDMVANSATGIAGSIGSLFNSLAPHIPVIGPAISLFSSFLSAYDAATQAKIALNIIKIAATGSKASELFEKVAIVIAKSNINLSKFPEADISEKIMSAINIAQDLQGSVMTSLADFVISKVNKKEIFSEDKIRGKSDGEEIAHLLIAYISAGHCEDGIDVLINFNILKKYLTDNGFIEIIATPNLPIITPLVSVYDNILPAISDGEETLNNPIAASPINKPQNINLALTGGALMKAMEIWPAIKYLSTNWIPVIQTIEEYGLTSEFLSKHEYEICTSLYITGSFALTYAAQASYSYAIASSIIYAIKPHIYRLENELLSFIMRQESPNESIKFALYVSTEASLSAVSLSFVKEPMLIIELLKYPANFFIDPLAFIKDPAIGYAFVQGGLIGSIKYLDKLNPKEDNIIGEAFSFLSTGAFFYTMNGLSQSTDNIANKIVQASAYISAGANLHYATKVIGNWAGEHLFEYVGSNSSLNSKALDQPE